MEVGRLRFVIIISLLYACLPGPTNGRSAAFLKAPLRYFKRSVSNEVMDFSIGKQASPTFIKSFVYRGNLRGEPEDDGEFLIVVPMGSIAPIPIRGDSLSQDTNRGNISGEPKDVRKFLIAAPRELMDSISTRGDSLSQDNNDLSFAKSTQLQAQSSIRPSFQALPQQITHAAPRAVPLAVLQVTHQVNKDSHDFLPQVLHRTSAQRALGKPELTHGFQASSRTGFQPVANDFEGEENSFELGALDSRGAHDIQVDSNFEDDSVEHVQSSVFIHKGDVKSGYSAQYPSSRSKAVYRHPLHQNKAFVKSSVTPSYHVKSDQKPMYAFQYQASAKNYGSQESAEYGHQEARVGAATKGRYFVDLPDGRRQIVDYYADETGYHPTITYI